MAHIHGTLPMYSKLSLKLTHFIQLCSQSVSACFSFEMEMDWKWQKKLVVKCEIYVEIPSDSCILAGIYSNGWFAMGWHFIDLAFKHHFREYMTRRSQITSVDAWHMNVKVYGLSHLQTRKGDKLDRTQTQCIFERIEMWAHILHFEILSITIIIRL